MATFLELQDEVLNHGFNATTYRTRVKDYINICQARIARAAEIRELLTSSSTVITVSNQSFPLPSDFIRLQQLIDNPNNRILIESDKPIGFGYLPANTGAPSFYSLGAGGICFLDVAADTSYQLTLFYYRDPPALSADADVSILPVDFHDLMVSFALSRAYRSEDDIQMSLFFYQEYERDLAKMRADREYPSLDGPRQVQGTWDSFIKEF